MIGTSLSHYRITAALGAGGMGEVFRATDTHLGREVAIKVLPADVAGDVERLARFRREAHLLAALNHPHIAAIHGLEEVDGKPFLVLELVEGEDLSERLKRGPVSVDEAIAVARQIALALEEAHEKGIVHRDLKPANIKLTPAGTVKVLDFGLAKAFGGDGAHSSGTSGLSQSPTVTRQGTRAGLILGTAAYMSPEQARGRPVDKRADIWAFGVVLFEMLTGRKLFEGETLSDTLAAILKQEPRFEELPANTPGRIVRLLRRCLQKDPRRRLRDLGDAREDLEEGAVDEVGATVVAHAGRAPRWIQIAPWGLVAAMALALLARTVVPRREEAADPLVARFEVPLPSGVEQIYMSLARQGVAISPDGAQVAFIGNRGGSRYVHVRRLDQLETRVLQIGLLPNLVFFSPDGGSLGVVGTDRTLLKASLGDGLVTTLSRDADVRPCAWAADGSIVFSRQGALWRVSASGGTETPLTTLGSNEADVIHSDPVALPDGRTVLFNARRPGEGDGRIEAVSLTGGDRRVVVEHAPLLLQYARSRHLLFLRDGALLAAPFDVQRLEVTGPTVLVLAGLEGIPQVALSRTGSLVYTAGGARMRIVEVSRAGTKGPLNDTPRYYQNPRLSPDGRRLLVEVLDVTGSVWLQDIGRGTFTRLTPGIDQVGVYPVWMPDGKQLIYRGGQDMRRLDVDGSGRSETLRGSQRRDLPSAVSPDGETLVYMGINPGTGGDIYTLSLRSDGEPHPVLETPAYEGGAQFSPDGRFLVYVSDETKRTEVYVRPFRGPERRWPVSTSGGRQPRWSGTGREIFYRSGDQMMVVEVKVQGAELTFSAPRVLFQGRYSYSNNVTIANYDVSADGQRFVMIEDQETPRGLTVVLNWFEELRRAAPVPGR